MEDRSTQDYSQMEDEEFSDEFQCCVCLDILYKPVVLACGHISCFWCVFHAMDLFKESHCPVCRNPYAHFPRICTLLHFLLMKLYPEAYKRKAKLVAEVEESEGRTSPQFAGSLTDSQLNEVLNVPETSSVLSQATESNSSCSDNSYSQDSLKITLPTTSSPQATHEHKETNGTLKRDDLQCSVCKQLLFRPVVLNCGHVFCDACTKTAQDTICKCPECQSPHPYGFPNVCLVLEHFLEKHFPEEYSARKESLPSIQNAIPSGSSAERKEQAPKSSSVPVDKHVSVDKLMSWYTDKGAKVHPLVGCDYCGMCPIVGERYKCKDCRETMGFDLCESCYNSSSKLPGRFNQQHTSDHQFVVEQPISLQYFILYTLGHEHMGEHVLDPNLPQEASRVPDLSNVASGHDRENTSPASRSSSGGGGGGGNDGVVVASRSSSGGGGGGNDGDDDDDDASTSPNSSNNSPRDDSNIL